MGEEIITLMYLGINSILDFYKKRISLLLAGGYTVIWLLFFMMGCLEEGMLPDRLLGLLPGTLLLVIGIASRGALGLGDGILVIPIGLYLGMGRTGIMILWAFALAFIWSVLLLCFGKKKKTYAFPFAPFLFAGLAGTLCF